MTRYTIHSPHYPTIEDLVATGAKGYNSWDSIKGVVTVLVGSDDIWPEVHRLCEYLQPCRLEVQHDVGVKFFGGSR